MAWNTVKEVIEALRLGEMVVVTDDENRENEGDLIAAAEFCTEETIQFMATLGRGLICMPIAESIASRLALHPMTPHNTDAHGTAFTVSIDAIETGTGISSKDRALTARRLAEVSAKPEDFKRPGHMFPLVAKPGGVLKRNGHTEATVDLMSLAGLQPCGLCCEIVADDGTMMKGDALHAFAEKYDLKMTTVKALQKYRQLHELAVERIAEAKLPTEHGLFDMFVYKEKYGEKEHIALVKRNGHHNEAVCRIHSECLTGDVFGSHRCDCGIQLKEAMALLAQADSSVLIYMRQEGRGIGLGNKIKAYALQEKGRNTMEANLDLGFEADAREYALCAHILKDLSIDQVSLLTNNPLKVEGLETYGITVKERIPLIVEASESAETYLHTKKVLMGHLI